MSSTLLGVTFTPPALTIGASGSGTASVTVLIDVTLSAVTVSNGYLQVRLVDADWVSDDILATARIPLPAIAPGTAKGGRPGRAPRAGDTVTLTHTFTLENDSGKVKGSSGSSDGPKAELAIESGLFGDNFGTCTATAPP